MTTFIPQPKIARFNRPVIITEKIDGTNAAVIVHEDGTVEAASKNQVLTIDKPDNHGFRAWVEENREELRLLGVGLHRGEWWGRGINKRHPNHEKTFSLFNVSRWSQTVPNTPIIANGYGRTFEQEMGATVLAPSCCQVVPLLAWHAVPCVAMLDTCARLLKNQSVADPLCTNPEGIVIYHTAGNVMLKYTYENDEGHKGQAEAA